MMELLHENPYNNILVVDDQPDNLRILSSMLRKQGYHVRLALSGQMALMACEKVLPDLILLDIMMPDLDGYQVCQKLKQNPKMKEVPIIFISALDDVLDKVKAFNVGGVDYITKPFQIEEVLARVKNQLTIRQLTCQLTEQNTQLQKLNAELRRSNTELEQFAYIASHDLQSPLQVIIGNADMLSWKYETILDENAERYINQIVDAAFRMKQLIQDLLAYSRVGTHLQEFHDVDCNCIFKEALENLREEILANQASVNYSDLPTLKGDGTQLMRLFQNLVSNAIKFRRQNVTPQVTISVQLQNVEWLFSVQDNGIGIEPKNYERIFQIFQRLHPSSEYPGSGIGMTICKKIVECHGGRIWVESQINSGTTFYFTLPAT